MCLANVLGVFPELADFTIRSKKSTWYLRKCASDSQAEVNIHVFIRMNWIILRLGAFEEVLHCILEDSSIESIRRVDLVAMQQRRVQINEQVQSLSSAVRGHGEEEMQRAMKAVDCLTARFTLSISQRISSPPYSLLPKT